jgi:hypothetical protein
MKFAGWKQSLAAFALAGMLTIPAGLPARAQGIIHSDPSIMYSNDTTLKVSGVVRAIGPETVALESDGRLLHIPMAMARFEMNGRTTDPTRLYAGLPVTASFGSLRGSVVAMNGGVLALETPGGVVELPATAFNSPMLAHSTIAFTDTAGHTRQMPVAEAIDLQGRGGGTMAFAPPVGNVAVFNDGSSTTVVSNGMNMNGTTITTSFVSAPTPAVAVQPLPGSSTVVTSQPLMLQGTVVETAPSMVTVDVNGQRVMVPSSMNARYTIDNAPVGWNDLSQGSRVTVLVPMSGSVSRIDNGVVTYDMGNGAAWSVPLAALPSGYTASTTVWMRDVHGNLVAVPMNAVTLQEQNGAVIVPASTIATPPDDMEYENRDDLDNVHNNLDMHGNFSNPTEPANIDH